MDFLSSKSSFSTWFVSGGLWNVVRYRWIERGWRFYWNQIGDDGWVRSQLTSYFSSGSITTIYHVDSFPLAAMIFLFIFNNALSTLACTRLNVGLLVQMIGSRLEHISAEFLELFASFLSDVALICIMDVAIVSHRISEQLDFRSDFADLYNRKHAFIQQSSSKINKNWSLTSSNLLNVCYFTH